MTTLERERPTIPPEEYPVRWGRVRALLAERDLDLLVAYADDRATFGAAHARWLADFPVHFEPVCILVRREGPPIMLVGPESDEYARLRGRIGDVRVLRELTHPDEDYPYSVIRGLAEILVDIDRNGTLDLLVGYASGRIEVILNGSSTGFTLDYLYPLTETQVSHYPGGCSRGFTNIEDIGLTGGIDSRVIAWAGT